MPLERFHKLDAERQAAILGAARAEFSANGYAGASYNAIIKAAGLSKGAMYYYFADKGDLCRTVVERVVDDLGRAVGDLDPFEDAPGYWAALRALTERAMLWLLATPEVADLGRLIYGEGTQSDVLAPLVERAEAWCTDLLRRGQDVGAVRNDMPLGLLAAAVTGLLVHTDRWIATRFEMFGPDELEELGASCLTLVEDVASPRR